MSQIASTALDPATNQPGPATDPSAKSMSLEERKQHDREVFRRMQGSSDGTVTPAPTPPQAVRFEEPKAPASDPAKAPPGGAPKRDESNPTAGGHKPTPADDADRRELAATADKILQRDGLSEKARKALIANLSPEELRADVEKRRAGQLAQDRLGNEAAALRRNANQDPKAKPGADGKTGAESSTDGLADLSPKQRKVIETIRGEGDQERAAEMLDAFREGRPAAKDQGAGAGSQRRQENEPNRQNPRDDGLTNEERARVNEDRMIKEFQAPLDQLASKYPGLKAEGDRRKLLQRADRLIRSGVIEIDGDKRPTIDEILLTTATIQYGPESSTAAQRELITSNRSQRTGQPDATETTQSAPNALTGKERDRAAYRMLASGKTPEEVQRVLASG